MAGREQRTVELEIISATNVKKVASLDKQDAYAIAYVTSAPRDWKSTTTDMQGNLNPVWNSKLTFTVDEELRKQERADIIVEVHCQSESESSNLLGEAKIPLHSLPEENSSPRSLGFDLLRPSGKSQGVINVSIKLGGKKVASAQDQQQQQRSGADENHERNDVPVTAYPATPAYNPASQMPQQPYGYAPQQAYGYPQQPPYGYAPYPYAYGGGYPPQSPPPYGYAPYAPQPPPPYPYAQQAPQQRFGSGLGGAGLGLGAGLLGGFLVGDAIGNLGDNDNYVENNYYGDGDGDYGGGDDGGGDF